MRVRPVSGGPDGPCPPDVRDRPPGRRGVVGRSVRVLTAVALAAALVPAVAGAVDGDDGPATSAVLNFPRGLAVAPGGDVVIADTNNNRVRRVSPSGTITPIAGGGGGTPALAESLNAPEGVEVASDGTIYLADTLNNRVRRIGTDGSISVLAGNGSSGFTGDGGPANLASMSGPRGLALTPDGGLLIADLGSRIRRVNLTTGVITTVVGTGVEGSSGDGGPATAATINRATGLLATPDGTVYLTDTESDRVRRVRPDGIIEGVAGTTSPGAPLGDGGQATEARLDDPRDVAIAQDGALLISDTGQDRVRRVDLASGVITTVAGAGVAGFGGDGGPAVAATFDEPTALGVAPDGAVLVADSRNRRVRRFVVGGPMSTLAGGEAASPAPDATPPGPVGPSGPEAPVGPPGPGGTTVGPEAPVTPAPAPDATVASAVAGPVTARRPGEERFRPLVADQVVVPGTEVDTTRGTLELTIRTPGRPSFRADIDGGRFVFTRGGKRSRYLTDLRLTGPACRPAAPRNDRRAPVATGTYPRPRRATRRSVRLLVPGPAAPLLGAPVLDQETAAPTTIAKRRRASRRLRVKRRGSGELRTRTNDAAAVARGTRWTTTESCTGTAYQVTEGRIAVRDLARGTERTVRRGGRLTVRAERPR